MTGVVLGTRWRTVALATTAYAVLTVGLHLLLHAVPVAISDSPLLRLVFFTPFPLVLAGAIMLISRWITTQTGKGRAGPPLLAWWLGSIAGYIIGAVIIDGWTAYETMLGLVSPLTFGFFVPIDMSPADVTMFAIDSTWYGVGVPWSLAFISGAVFGPNRRSREKR